MKNELSNLENNAVEARMATEEDVADWMALVDRVRDGFPGLDTPEALAEHRNTVLEFIRRESAICAKLAEKTVGALLFSRDANALCFLAVDPDYRRRRIALKTTTLALSFLDMKKGVTVTTWRADAPEGIAARAFYRRLGFVEGKLTEEFGVPVQELVLKR